MPLSRLLIAVDFSPASLAAARWATSSLAPQAEVVLAHAVDVPTPPGFLRTLFSSVDQVQANALPGAQARLAELRESLNLPGAAIDVRAGRAFKTLSAACTDHGAGLLVIGPHGNRTGLGRLLGSTAEKAVRESTVPVLVTAGGESGRPKRIVVAVDDSPGGRHALLWAADLARSLEAELIAVNVVDALLAGAVGMAGSAKEREKALLELREASEQWLQEATVGLGLPAGPLRLVVRSGHPADEVINTAREVQADVLVIGRNTSTAPGIYSSVADLVVRATTTATVVVPA
jgi:nucleotide-binding universal stress UspA family protein